MGQQRQAAADQAGRAAGGACVWAVAAVLFLAVLAGGGCLVFYLALPPAEVPEWLPVAGLSLVALPWAFWIATCAYRLCCCCCSSSSSPEQANAAAERQPSSSTRPAAVAPLPSSTNLKSAVRSAMGSYSHSGTRRVHFGDSTVLGEKAAGAGAGEPAVVEEVEEEEEKECSSATSSHESEAPIAQSMPSSR
ncbi:hypothetical protein OsI_37701 [Oryza sativa Indica Group]|uniref:Uncharacterized protein n=2 Tax=Oryza TaxID=4527 RepID=A0A0E0ILV5_ORYNI|nr:hypothetical protein OsI_37701 [Oryza sativa Indica Group]